MRKFSSAARAIGRSMNQMTTAATRTNHITRVAVFHGNDSPVAEKVGDWGKKVNNAQFVLCNGDDPDAAPTSLSKDIDAVLIVPPCNIQVLDDNWDKLESIKWVHCFFAGVDSLSVLSGKRLDGIPLTNGRGAFSSSLAEYVIMATLHFNKQVPRLLLNRANKLYERFTMDVIKNKKIGFVGFGDIAQHSCIAAHALGMVPIVFRRDPSKKSEIINFDYKVCTSLEELLKEADVVVCTLPATPKTTHLFNATRFAQMKEGATFISCGRGLCVDENALYDAVSSNHIRAALDVFETEPLPKNSRLWTLPDSNFLLTAHNADLTHDYYELGWLVFCDNLQAFQQGTDFKTLVDQTQGY